MLKENLHRVEERIERAAAHSGRRRDEIRLLAVTKKFPAAVIREAYQLGLREFAENYVQEFEGKHTELLDLAEARFHLIGHLQSNKARKAAELFDVVQTIDTAKLAERLSVVKPLDVLLEVRLSPEQTKEGAAPESLAGLIEAIETFSSLRLCGLMTMPPWSSNPEESRPYFARLRRLAEEHRLKDLSMGMSHDLEAAIEEGATMVRIGTALFGPRPKA